MTTIVLIIHLLIALALVGVILLQRSEGGALGIGGGGMGGLMTGRLGQSADPGDGSARRGLHHHKPVAGGAGGPSDRAELDPRAAGRDGARRAGRTNGAGTSGSAKRAGRRLIGGRWSRRPAPRGSHRQRGEQEDCLAPLPGG
jgi:hypothetical protein